ncbi:cupin domain-containing protein [Thalassobacillus sp. CUG 92003]|uniref:cupin domain-containing protein n=1 Tax=Thalassobacillus sp. CUG 92003 TaxID=2736641 RepID=UPI0015E6597E|nr:cupin domain-containing protein [Thalassobacillus sp. CUG 92003]
MYYAPYVYPDFYDANRSMYHTDIIGRSSQATNQSVMDSLIYKVKEEAETIDFYNRLADAAPHSMHKQTILHILEDENRHLKQFTDLYIKLTGSDPEYTIEQIPFSTYREGVEKAYRIELEGCDVIRNHYLIPHLSLYRDFFLQTWHDEFSHVKRFEVLVSHGEDRAIMEDYGNDAFVVNIDEATKQNNTFRTAIWTGENLQVTLMSIGVGEDIGLEVHPDVDQFLRIEQGQGLVQMGNNRDQLDFQDRVYDDYAIMVPAGKWHNVTNTGNVPLKLYTIYAPPEHPFGTIHETKADAEAAEYE